MRRIGILLIWLLLCYLITGCASLRTPQPVVSPAIRAFQVSGIETSLRSVEDSDVSYLDHEVFCRGVVTNVYPSTVSMVGVSVILKDVHDMPIAIEKEFLTTYMQPGESREFVISKRVHLSVPVHDIEVRVSDGCTVL